MAKNPWDAIPSLKYNMEGIKDAISIRDALSKYCGINAGNGRKSFNCPSPDHTDKTPSASINTKSHDTQCHCFGCGRNFDVFDLAKIAKGDMKFNELVESVCSDFGLDSREYSNYYEREDLIQRMFHTKDFTFVDIYSRLISIDEQEFLGLHDSNGRNCEITYGVDALEYDLTYFGEPDKESLWANCFQHRMTREKFDEQYQNPDGSRKIIDISRGEAATIMGWFDEGRYVTDENGREHYERYPDHEYLPPYRLAEVWQDDKKGVEELLFGKCAEGYENTLKAMNKLASAIRIYEKKMNVNTEREFVKQYRADRWKDDVSSKELVDTIEKGGDIRPFLKPEYQTDEAQRRIRCFEQYDRLRPRLLLLADKLPEYQRIQDKMLSYVLERQDAYKTLGKAVDGVTLTRNVEIQLIDDAPTAEFQRKYPDLVKIEGMEEIYEQAYKMYIREKALEMGATVEQVDAIYPVPDGWVSPWNDEPKGATPTKNEQSKGTAPAKNEDNSVPKGENPVKNDTAPVPPQGDDVPPQGGNDDGIGID